jgi:hypothetical protein
LILIPAPVPDPDPDLFSTVFQQLKFVQNLAFSMLKVALFPRKLGSIFFGLCITFYIGSGSIGSGSIGH